MTRWFCFVVSTLALVGCSNSSSEKSAVGTYAQRALKLHTEGQDKDVTFNALRNARVFGVRADELDRALRDPRYKDAKDQAPAEGGREMSLDEFRRLRRFADAIDIPTQDLHKMTARDKKWDDIEVALLLDDDVVGDARCWDMETGEGEGKIAFFLFVTPNKLTLEEIVSRHGQPHKQHESPGGTRFAFYGRIMVIQPKDGLDPLVCRFTK